jgi:hypothetical protein
MDIAKELKKYNEEITRLNEERHEVSERFFDIVKSEIYADDPDIEFLLWLDDNLVDGLVSFDVSRRLRWLKKQGVL